MTTYSYDRENRLISQNVDGNVTSFAYDGFGRKRRESRGVNPDVILNWDGDQMIVESSDLDPEAPSKAYYVADGVIYAENANLGSRRSRRDYAVDYLGSVTGLTDSDASLSSVRRWSGYGKLLSGSSEPIGYFWTGNTGSRVYQSLGLNDNRARHYGRNIKQWITRDPLWPSELPYAYVGGNPVTRIDPNGKAFWMPANLTQAEKNFIRKVLKDLSKIKIENYIDSLINCIERELTDSGCAESDFERIDLEQIHSIVDGSNKIDVYQIEIQLNYNCGKGECARLENGWFFDKKKYLHLCVTKGPPIAFRENCGFADCAVLHEILHAVGLKHPEHNNALRCLNSSVPECKTTPMDGPGWK
jgi:RHS repeat-associated protein